VLIAGILFSGFSAYAQRLPTNARPEHYSISLTPDLKTATFAGSETIDLVLEVPSNTVTLNAAEIKFLSVKAGAQIAAITQDDSKEQATLTFPQALPAGRVTLGIEYTGVLN